MPARLAASLRVGDAVGECELAFPDLSERFHHQRNLDNRHGLHRVIGIKSHFLAGFETFYVDSPIGIDRFRDSLDIGFQPRQGSRKHLGMGSRYYCQRNHCLQELRHIPRSISPPPARLRLKKPPSGQKKLWSRATRW